MSDNPSVETDVGHVDGEQDTGNHPAPGAGHHVPGGERAGVENVEPVTPGADQAPDGSTEADLDESLSVNGPAERPD